MHDGPLTPADLDHFLRFGFLVKEDLIPPALVHAQRQEVRQFLHKKAGIDPDHPERDIHRLARLGSGFGGFLECYLLPAMTQIRTHPNLYAAFAQLYAATYSTAYHPDWPNELGPFLPRRMYSYINRCAFRVPDAWWKKKKPAQRGTGPHLDIHPTQPFTGVDLYQDDTGQRASRPAPLRFWHPIQGLVAISDALTPGCGGFQTVPGFHLKCRGYFLEKGIHGRNPLRWGNATHITKTHHPEVYHAFEFIPARAGSLVVWDWRMPHQNEAHNLSDVVRETVYTAFLPDVAPNQSYSKTQLSWYQSGTHPEYVAPRLRHIEAENYTPPRLDTLGQRLMGLLPWEGDD